MRLRFLVVLLLTRRFLLWNDDQRPDDDDRIITSSIVDDDFHCPTWAEQGYCDYDKQEDIVDDDSVDNNSMIDVVSVSCRRSCMISNLLRIVVLDDADDDKFGVEQTIDWYGDPSGLELLVLMKETQIYMEQRQRKRGNNNDGACRNLRNDCAVRAAMGHCLDSNYLVEMQLHCSPMCQTCHLLSKRQHCNKHNDESKGQASSSWFDIDKMFQRLATYFDSNDNPRHHHDIHYNENNATTNTVKTTILSQPTAITKKISTPWILSLENLLSPMECQHVIQLAYDIGYKPSTIFLNEDEKDELTNTDDDDDGLLRLRPAAQQTQSVTNEQWRTSSTAWCDYNCQRDDPIVNTIVDRISKLVGLPRQNMERIQLLKYTPGDYYVKHHDYIEHQRYLPCGPRILTLLIYLNDLSSQNGGETVFYTSSSQKQLTVSIQPQQGMGVLWSNVLLDNPLLMDPQTYHEARPVTTTANDEQEQENDYLDHNTTSKHYQQRYDNKYAANIWFHLGNYQHAYDTNCT